METKHIHVIPVDPTQTADEAWHEQCVFGKRVTDSGLGEYWAVMRCEGWECANITENVHREFPT